jgi:lysine 2,3-aminomutase
MGYLPGYATPRLVCDVPFLGKMWVHQVAEYDRELGVSKWRANDWAGDGVVDGFAEYYDPIHSLPEAGQAWWRAEGQADR